MADCLASNSQASFKLTLALGFVCLICQFAIGADAADVRVPELLPSKPSVKIPTFRPLEYACLGDSAASETKDASSIDLKFTLSSERKSDSPRHPLHKVEYALSIAPVHETKNPPPAPPAKPATPSLRELLPPDWGVHRWRGDLRYAEWEALHRVFPGKARPHFRRVERVSRSSSGSW